MDSSRTKLYRSLTEALIRVIVLKGYSAEKYIRAIELSIEDDAEYSEYPFREYDFGRHSSLANSGSADCEGRPRVCGC